MIFVTGGGFPCWLGLVCRQSPWTWWEHGGNRGWFTEIYAAGLMKTFLVVRSVGWDRRVVVVQLRCFGRFCMLYS